MIMTTEGMAARLKAADLKPFLSQIDWPLLTDSVENSRCRLDSLTRS
jgi:hypothetical protein